MGTNEIESEARDRSALDQEAASRWNDPLLAAQALLSGRAPFLADSLPTSPRQSAAMHGAIGRALESAKTASNAATPSRWSDPQSAAQALLNGTVPFLADGFAMGLGHSVESQSTVGNARESRSATATPAAASRWSDPKLAAQALLSPSVPFTAAPLEQVPTLPISLLGSNFQGSAESLEGTFDPAKHPRGGNPRNPGQFSRGAGGGAVGSPKADSGKNITTLQTPSGRLPPTPKQPGNSLRGGTTSGRGDEGRGLERFSHEELNDLYADYMNGVFKSRDAAVFITSAAGKAEFERIFGTDAEAAAAYQQLREFAIPSIAEFDRQDREDKRIQRDKAAAQQRRDATQPLESQPSLTENQRKQALERAHLADAAYGGASPGPGWKSVQVWEPGANSKAPAGFRAELFQNEATGEYVLAFAGTDDLYDGVADGAQAAGLKTQQYEYAMNLAQEVVAKQADGDPAKVEFVGHSLGGGLATAAAAVTGAQATTFNPAGVAEATVARFKGQDGKKHSLADLKPSQVTAYQIPEEIVGTTQDALPGLPDTVGRKVRLRIDSSPRDYAGMIIGGKIGLGFSRHLMDNFFRALAPPKPQT